MNRKTSAGIDGLRRVSSIAYVGRSNVGYWGLYNGYDKAGMNTGMTSSVVTCCT